MCSIKLPVALVLDCGGRIGMLTVDELVDAHGATNHTDMKLECVRVKVPRGRQRRAAKV